MLQIDIKSFSYKKTGYPKDTSNNGGGFVFDCRGILNPGRIDEYKTQTGLDAPVRTYLETLTIMPQFMQHVIGLTTINIDDYIARGFTHLCINFGCTGGQHRSVYAADTLSKYLKTKYPDVQINVQHIEQNISY
jgi:RNase adaptor protein for sRNA GlmZ degradation